MAGFTVGQILAAIDSDRANTINAATLTALINVFTASLKGLVPAPVTPAGKFLRDDGTWATVTGNLDPSLLVTGSGNITLQAASGPDGSSVSILGGLASTPLTGIGGGLIISGGSGEQAGGILSLDAGAGISAAPGGDLHIGTDNAESIQIGRIGKLVYFNGKIDSLHLNANGGGLSEGDISYSGFGLRFHDAASDYELLTIDSDGYIKALIGNFNGLKDTNGIIRIGFQAAGGVNLYSEDGLGTHNLSVNNIGVQVDGVSLTSFNGQDEIVKLDNNSKLPAAKGDLILYYNVASVPNWNGNTPNTFNEALDRIAAAIGPIA